MVATKTVVHYTAISVTVFLGLILLFAFSGLSGLYAPQLNGLNQTSISVGSIGSSNTHIQAGLKTTSAFGTNSTSKVALRVQMNISSIGYGQTSFQASNALETQIYSLWSVISGSAYSGPAYSLNITNYNITKQGSGFKAYSNISVTILRPSNVSHVIGFIDAIPNTVVQTVAPVLTQANLTALEYKSVKGAAANATSQISFYLGNMPVVYSKNIIISGLPIQVSRVTSVINASSSALSSALTTPVSLKGSATVNATYSTVPINNVMIGNSITVRQYGSAGIMAPNGNIFITINATGTTPQLATSSLNASLIALRGALQGYINGNSSLISTSNYRVKFYLSGQGPQFYALENIAVTIPNTNNMSSSIGSIPTVPGAYVTGVGTGYTSSQAAVVQNEISNLISNSTQVARYVAGSGKAVYLTSVTIQQRGQGPQVYLNSTTSPGSISVNSRIYNQSVFLNSLISSTFEYANPTASSLKLTTAGIASGIPAQASITVHLAGNGTTGQLATNSLLNTLSRFNSSVSKFINSNFSLVTVPSYNVSYNNSRYNAYVNVRVLVPNIANVSAVQRVLGLLPNATVTGVTLQLSPSQLSSLEAQALASAIAQAKAQISIVLGGSSAAPQIKVTSQNFTVSQASTVVSTSVSSQPVVVPTITQGLNGTQSVVATVNITATVNPTAIR